MLTTLVDAHVTLSELDCLALLAQGPVSRRALSHAMLRSIGSVDVLLCRMRKKHLIEAYRPGLWQPSGEGWAALDNVLEFLGRTRRADTVPALE